MIPANKQRLFESLFLVYVRRLMRRHFAAVHIAGVERLRGLDGSLPLILVGNHSCWWDGFLDFYLCKTLFHVNPYLMMEEKQLRRYRFFTRFGAFSVNRESPRESYESVQYAVSVLQEPGRGLILYPQGIMLPNDFRPLSFSSGIGRMAVSLGKVLLVPVAHRYEFVGEQRPEAFVSVGEPILSEGENDAKRLAAELEAAVTALLDSLRCAITGKETQWFSTVIHGVASTNVKYDRARGMKQ